MVHIIYSYISEENHSLLLKKFLPLFSVEFQKKINKYKKWQDAQLSLLGRILLLNTLEKQGKSWNEEDLKYNRFDRPYFENETLNFNISHSGEIAICALIDRNKIGIDIEEKQCLDIQGFKHQMTQDEWSKIHESKDQTNAFFAYWTGKEAVVKAHGQGLSIPLKSFEIVNGKTKLNQNNFYLKQLKIDNAYVCNVASDRYLESVPIDICKITTEDLILNNKSFKS